MFVFSFFFDSFVLFPHLCLLTEGLYQLFIFPSMRFQFGVSSGSLPATTWKHFIFSLYSLYLLWMFQDLQSGFLARHSKTSKVYQNIQNFIYVFSRPLFTSAFPNHDNPALRMYIFVKGFLFNRTSLLFLFREKFFI